jgi:uncharacterized membrane protein HdeD (DUF308 family)
MSESKTPAWWRGVAIGLGALAIVLSVLVFVHPGITVLSIIFILGIIMIIVGIEKIISGIFITNKSRWGTIGLGILALIFGSIALGYPVHTAAFVIIMLGIALLFIGISHIVYGVGRSQDAAWARGFSIGAGALAISLSLIVMASPLAGAIFVSTILTISLLIIGIEIIVVGTSGRIKMMSGKTIGR